MEPANESRKDTSPVLKGVALALGACVLACLAWAMLGYGLAWKLKLSLGIIVPPLAAGLICGGVMRYARPAFSYRTGWVAVASVFVACVVGDLIWIKLANNKPFGVLLGAELRQTLNTLFNLQKAVMYAAACYIAYAIANPPRVYATH